MHHLNNILCVGVGAAFLVTATAQQDKAAQDEKEAVFRSDTRLVLLHATVVDNKGHLVTNLQRQAFKVFENNIEQQLKIFRREDVPISMCLIVDNSGSMRDKRQRVETAALQLVKASNPQDEVMIVNFNDDAFEDVPFTNDVKKMEEGLTRIDARGGTAMRDAIALSIDRVKEKAKRDKKVLLVITDGNDNTSAITLEKLVQKAQESEILVYAVGLLNQEERREAKRAQRALDSLTEASGGQAYYPKEVAEVDKLALQVAHEIRNQYILAYSPAIQTLDGTFRRIKVTANGPNRPVVRTRSGYYATPDLEQSRTSSSARSQGDPPPTARAQE